MTIVAVNGGGNTPNETRVDTVNIQAVDQFGSTDDLDLAASTADADAAGVPSVRQIIILGRPKVTADDDSFVFETSEPSSDEPQQFTSDDGGAGAQGNWIWNVNVSTTHAGTPVAADCGRDGSIALLGTSDALAPTDFFVA